MITDYYGGSKDRTVLRIFTRFADGSPDIIHREFLDAEAYDRWHLSFYFHEILKSRALLKSNRATIDDVPRKEKDLLIYLILAAHPSVREITELGSSLFEMIDNLELVRFTLKNSAIPDVDPKNISFFGIELSDLLIQASKELHLEYDLRHVRSVAEIDRPIQFLYDRSVTNYALETSREFADLLNRSNIALINTFFSLGETFDSRRLAKRLVYFSLPEILTRLKKPLFHLFGERAPRPKSEADLSGGRPVVEGFFFAGEREQAEAFIKLGDRHPKVSAWLKEKNIRVRPAQELLSISEALG
jgi:hypothetical protein